MRRSHTYLAKATMIGALAFGSLIAAAAAVFAYPGVPSAGTVTASSCGQTIPAGDTCTITARFVDSSGRPVGGVSVSWTVNGVCGSITPNPSVTDANGNTTVVFHACNANGTPTASVRGDALLASVVDLAAFPVCGPGTVTGTTGDASVTVGVNVACTASSGGNLLPTASTGSPTDGFNARWALVAVALVGMLVAIGGGARLKRARRLNA